VGIAFDCCFSDLRFFSLECNLMTPVVK
jgi:hypothetical protein